MKIRLLLAALAAPLLVPVPASSAHAADAVVSFPSVTRFNPELTSYAVRVDAEDVGTGTYRVATGTDQVVVPPSGEVAVSFAVDGVQSVQVLHCVAACTLLAESAPLTVRRRIAVQLRPGPAFGPARPVAIPFVMLPGPVELTWTVVDPADPAAPIASGTATAPDVGSVVQSLAVPLPLSTPTGTYELRWEGVHDSEAFGHLEASLPPARFRWDRDPPTVSVTVSEPDRPVYPIRDGYRDNLVFEATASGGIERRIRVVDVDDRVVGSVMRSGRFYRWYSTRPLAAGAYRLLVTSTDSAGNATTVTRAVDVRAERVEWESVDQTLSARALLVDSSVGRCSRLARLRAGGLGLYSQTRCTRPEESTVAVVAGIRAPASVLGEYRSFSLTVNGGRARGARKAYALLQYYDERTRTYRARLQLPARRGAHRGITLTDRRFTDYVGEDREFFWALALTGGSRYDVLSYRIRFERQVLR